MLNDAALSTLVLLAAWFAARGTLTRLERQRLREIGTALMDRPLAHWRYAADEWQRYCQGLRCQLWYGYLRPAARCASPARVLAGALAIVLERRSGLAPGLATAIIAANALAIASVIIGPMLLEFVRLTRLQRLEYEVYVAEAGVVEVWRQGNRIDATQEHLYNVAGGTVRHVEASDAGPAEIIFQVDQPGFAGVARVEEHFLVPGGHLAEAREIARRLTARKPATRGKEET
jgi:hypothetical protein